MIYFNGCIDIGVVPNPPNQESVSIKLLPPSKGVYHAAFPGLGPTEDIVTSQRVLSFEKMVGKKIVWAYFSNNWGDGISFPKREVEALHNIGVVPFIRLMPRTTLDTYVEEHEFTLDNIIEGKFDDKLKAWVKDAKNTGIPICVEFAGEPNGDWFPWSAIYNGMNSKTAYGDPNKYDGPEKYVDAYRHIIDIFREQGAHNITWFFHTAAYNWPDEPWNKMNLYYPGDDYIDWIGDSVYGPMTLGEEWLTFTEIMDDIDDNPKVKVFLSIPLCQQCSSHIYHKTQTMPLKTSR